MKTTRRANATRSGGSSATPWRETISEVQGTCDGRKLLLLGIQTGDKLAKPPFSVAYSRLCRHCRNLTEGGCRLSRFHFRLCRYFLDHVACRNLPWQGLMYLDFSPPSWVLLLILRSVTGSPRFADSKSRGPDLRRWPKGSQPLGTRLGIPLQKAANRLHDKPKGSLARTVTRLVDVRVGSPSYSFSRSIVSPLLTPWLAQLSMRERCCLEQSWLGGWPFYPGQVFSDYYTFLGNCPPTPPLSQL